MADDTTWNTQLRTQLRNYIGFHVAVCLFSNRSQMKSKCGKYQKVALEAIAKCISNVLKTFDVFIELF